MANLSETRRRLRWVAGLLLAVDIAAAAALLSPLAGGTSSKQQEFSQIRSQVQQGLRTAVPPDQVQQRVEEARKQIGGFYKDRIPLNMSAISKQLGDVAAHNGVQLVSANYNTQESELPGLEQVSIQANLVGGYLQEVKFINALERGQIFFIVDGVTLGEIQGGQVRLAVTLESYLRNGSGSVP